MDISFKRSTYYRKMFHWNSSIGNFSKKLIIGSSLNWNNKVVISVIKVVEKIFVTKRKKKLVEKIKYRTRVWIYHKKIIRPRKIGYVMENKTFIEKK